MFLDHEDDGPALIDAATGQTLTYRDLGERTRARAEAFGPSKALVFVFLRNTLDSVIAYLAALRAGHAVALLDPQAKAEFVGGLLAAYQPDFVHLDQHDDVGLDVRLERYEEIEPNLFRRPPAPGALPAPHPDLAILLTTSGSTGSPKLVRLSALNVTSNATAIATALRIDRAERAVTSMPLHYSYGMSILNSHLIAGASVIVSDASVLEPRFWDDLRSHGATSLAGVPYTYQMLERIGFDPADQPTLRSMTQAGGKMPEPLLRRYAERLAPQGIGLYVMYGQTEAAPRIAVLPAERLADKVGSAGVALPGGVLTIHGPDGPTDQANVSGEVIYSGSNVMMGYADGRADLALGDVHGDTLHTGDLGYLDEEGFLFITGRSKRIAKLYGVRVGLDDVERLLAHLGPVAVTGGSDQLHVHHEPLEADLVLRSRKQLALDLGVPARSLVFHELEGLPTLATGKMDYRALVALHEDQP
jgi:acyl-CoA synthetase (AMP-forming)/AMP-acid ligase II